MLISLRSIYKTSVTDSLKEFTGSLQREASIPAAFHTPAVVFKHQLDETVSRQAGQCANQFPADTSETS